MRADVGALPIDRSRIRRRTRLEEGARVVTFGNGMVARELIVDIDDAARRVAWSVVGGRMTHHNASAQVFPDGETRCRFVWIADLLPNDVAPAIASMIEQGIAVISRRWSAAHPGRSSAHFASISLSASEACASSAAALHAMPFSPYGSRVSGERQS
jgi:hypothetical protein